MFECGWVTQPFVHPAVWFHLTLPWEGWREPWNVPRTKKVSFWNLPPQGLARPSWDSPAAPKVLLLSLAEEPCCTPWSCLPAGPCSSTWSRGLLAAQLVLFAQQSHGLLLYLVLPPLLSILFLVQLDLPATTSPRKGEGPHSGEPPTLYPQGLPQTSQQLRNINSTC